MYRETCENNAIKQGDAISNTPALVLLTEPNIIVGTPNNANRTSGELKCSKCIKCIVITHIPVNISL